jgi:hypothetical protein
LTAAFAVALVALGGVYTAEGLRRLVWDVPGSFPVDLRLRWVESRLLAEGRNNQDVGHPDPLLSPVHEVMVRSSGGYPPWSYAFGLLFAPPVDWTLVRWWFAAISLLSMAAMGAIAWTRARALGAMPALVAALLPFTNFANAICLSYGQYGVPVSALVMGAACLLEHNRRVLPGVMLGLSLVKPQLSATYCVAMLATRRWGVVATTGAAIAAGTLLMAAFVGESPSSVATKALNDMGGTHISTNPAMAIALDVSNRSAAVVSLGLAGAAVVFVLAPRLAGDPFRLASLAVIVAMFWTHRKHFDVAMMSLPLIWLWVNAVRTGRPLHYGVFFATGLTLWLPLRDAQWELWWVGAAQLVVWPAAAVLIAAAPRAPAPVAGLRPTA